MKRILSDSEKRSLIDSISNSVSKDAMGIHMLRDFIDSGVRLPQGDYSISAQELEGIKEYVVSESMGKVSGIKELDNMIKGCHRCSLRDRCGNYGPTLASGGIGAEIMLVGSSPDASDWVSGVPFSGETSVILEKFFEITGITREECWITNVCKCHTGKEVISQGNILSCLDNFREELSLVKPKLVIAFGDEAMSILTGNGSGLTNYVGQIFQNSVGLSEISVERVAILPHPTYAIRSKRLMAEFEYGCEKIKEFLEAL
jgi:uracil-DNA glycosylase family 4